MKAVLCKQFGPPESLVVEDLPSPTAGAVFALIAIIGLLFGQSCKKCDTPEPVTVTVFVPAPVVVNNLVGTWIGKEYYKAYINDSLTTTNNKDITLVLNANATGSFTAFSETSSIGWANPPSKFSIVTRITNTSASTAIGYLLTFGIQLLRLKSGTRKAFLTI